MNLKTNSTNPKNLTNYQKITRITRLVMFVTAILLLIVTFCVADIDPVRTVCYDELRNKIVASTTWRDDYADVCAMLAVLVFPLLFLIVCITNIIGKIRDKIKISGAILLTLALSLFCSGVSTFCFLGMDDSGSDSEFYPVCYRFSDSERPEHQIVIQEISYLLYGGGTVYQIMDDNQVSVIGNFSTDDGLRNHGNYEISWSDSGAEITYLYDNVGEDRYETVNVIFSDSDSLMN